MQTKNFFIYIYSLRQLLKISNSHQQTLVSFFTIKLIVTRFFFCKICIKKIRWYEREARVTWIINQYLNILFLLDFFYIQILFTHSRLYMWRNLLLFSIFYNIQCSLVSSSQCANNDEFWSSFISSWYV
jgi:hypothetical protein